MKGKKRKFGGESFAFAWSTPSKAKARKRAASFRKRKGTKARVVRHKKGWALYVRGPTGRR